jgi:hypothetical protein
VLIGAEAFSGYPVLLALGRMAGKGLIDLALIVVDLLVPPGLYSVLCW